MDQSATSAREAVRQQEPVERFKPTTGAFVGWAGLVAAAGVAVWTVVDEHSLLAVRVVLGCLFAAVLIWVTQLRPRATAYAEVLLMQGSIRDAYVPLALVDEVTMGRTLNVWVGRKRIVCVGIGRPASADRRPRGRAPGRATPFAPSGGPLFSGAPEPLHPSPQISYHTFVLDRINGLVAAARRPGHDSSLQLHQQYAVREVVALAGSGLLLVLSLLV